MIMDADTVEACLLATGDKSGELGQGPANRDPESDADRGHLTSFLRFEPNHRKASEVGLT
jgi:hypothetical protein